MALTVANDQESWQRIMNGSRDPQILEKGTSRNNPGGSVQEVVRAAQEELRELMQQRAQIMKRIGSVKQTIVGLSNLFGDDILSGELLKMLDRKSNRQMGFTKNCRLILMEANRPLSAREVCEQMQKRIPPVIERHKDPLASVTTVLNRLVQYGEARAVVRENGYRAWEWVSEFSSVHLA
jgi:hypothetical protein